MEILEKDRGIEITASCYRLLLERDGGYAVREVEITGAGRLDRFDRPGEGPHPTCMYFDNFTVNYAFQLGHYGKVNSNVEASIEENAVRLRGDLLPIVDDARGRVVVSKKISFEEDLYSVDLMVTFENTGPVSYASVWWDVNDKWLRSMRSSAGVLMPLRVGIGDCFDEDLSSSWRRMESMDRGAGIWMEMNGERASVLAAARSIPPVAYEAGGMKYWDGPDDADAGEGVSHGCINLDVINCELSGVEAVSLEGLELSYTVFLSPATVVRSRPG